MAEQKIIERDTVTEEVPARTTEKTHVSITAAR